MDKGQQISTRMVWALAWRSVLYLPLVVLGSTALLGGAALLVCLPVLSAVAFWVGNWERGVLGLVAWVALVWVWLRFRLWEFLSK